MDLSKDSAKLFDTLLEVFDEFTDIWWTGENILLTNGPLPKATTDEDYWWPIVEEVVIETGEDPNDYESVQIAHFLAAFEAEVVDLGYDETMYDHMPSAFDFMWNVVNSPRLTGEILEHHGFPIEKNLNNNSGSVIVVALELDKSLRSKIGNKVTHLYPTVTREWWVTANMREVLVG